MRTNSRLLRGAVVLLGLVASQFILYGPSLLGKKILLPLDLLETDVASGKSQPHDRLLTDPISQCEPMRQFAVSEVRAGRLPLWNPYNYCGSPFLAANQPAVFSPFRVLDYLWPDPWALAWGQMLRAIVGGVGAYLFFRRAMRAKFFAAAFGAWVWPNSGFLVLWTMWTISATALWLPWVLLAVHQIVRRPRAGWIIGLAVLTAFTLVSGHSATGGHVLLASGLYALWMLWRRRRQRVAAMSSLLAGWLLGGCLAAPQVLPTLEYMRHSLRMTQRLEHGVETAPVGAGALPQFVLPWSQGTARTGWIYLLGDNQLESAIGGYVGLMTVLVLLPFGLTDRRRRPMQLFWLAMALVGSAYVLNLPGGWQMHRLPVLSSLRGNRFVVVTTFALLAGGVAGLDSLLGGRVRRTRWLLAAPALSVLLAGWCVWRYVTMSDIVARHAAGAIELAAKSGVETQLAMVRVLDDVNARFSNLHALYACLCLAAAVAALWVWRRPARGAVVLVALLAVGEVLISAWQVNPQTDRRLYKWNLPAYQAIASAGAGRISGALCLPPMVNMWPRLADIRGYDGADPLRYVEFLDQFVASPSPPPDASAATYALMPEVSSPLTDFINLRYVIYRGRPADPAAARFVTPTHYVMENPRAMPRVTVPKGAVILADKQARLAALRDPQFDPRQTVIIEQPIPLPAAAADGTARIVGEVPSRVEIEYTLHSDGFIVLADSWDAGWRATVNGRPAKVLRANHAFRAVAVPAGSGRLIFSYEPASFAVGLWLAAGSVVGLVGIGCWHSLLKRAMPMFRTAAACAIL